MAENKVIVRIGTDVAGVEQGVRVVNRQLDYLTDRVGAASSACDTLRKAMNVIGGISIAGAALKGLDMLKSALESVFKTALDYNKILENSRLGIAAIITSMANITDAAGRQLQGQQKFNAAVQVAVQQQRQLETIAMATAATYQELVTVYQALLAPAMAAKLTLGQTVSLTGLLANSVKAMGLPMNQIVQESRDMLTGNIDNNSQLAKSLGITREMVKEWTNKKTLFDEITKRLEGFTYASREFENTWDGAVSNLKDALQKALGTGMQPLMQPLIDGVKGVSTAFLDVERNADGTVKSLKVKQSIIEGIYTYVANPLYKAWLAVQGAAETLNDLFVRQGGLLRPITDMVRIMLGWVVGIVDGWGWIVAAVLPALASGFTKVSEIVAYMLRSALDFGHMMLNALRAVGESLGDIMKAAWQGITGDFKGAGDTLAGIFKGRAVENMRGWSAELQKSMAGAKTAVSGLGGVWDQFLDKTVAWQQGLKKGGLDAIGDFGVQGKGGPADNSTAIKKAQDKAKAEYEKHLKELRQIDDAYRQLQNADAQAALQANEQLRRIELQQLESMRGQDLIGHAAYLAKKADLNEQAAAEQVRLLEQQAAAAMQASTKAEQELFSSKGGNKDQIVAYYRAQENEIKALAALQKGYTDQALSGAKDQLSIQQQITSEVEKLKTMQEELQALKLGNTELSAGMIGGNSTDIADVHAREIALLDNRYQKEFDLIDQKTRKLQEAYDKENKVGLKAANLADQIATLKIKKELLVQKKTLESADISDKAYHSQLGMASMYTGMAGQMFQTLASVQDQSSREGFESAKALNIAAAVMNTASAIMQQLASMPGPAGWAGAALAAATGAIQIATIASTTFGGGAQAPSAPSGSFASAGIASGGASGFGSLTVPLMSIQDSQSAESMERLTASTDNVAVAIGRLSTGIDRLTSLFSEGGAGMGLASNMPGRFADLSGTKQINPFGTTALMNSLKDGAFMNGVGTAALTLFTGGLSSVFGSLFASENRLMGSGIQLAVTNGVVQALNYEDREQGSWWGGSKRVIYTSPNEEAGMFMEALVTPMRNEIDRIALTLGTAANASAVNISATSILGSGATPEEAAKALEEWTLKYLQSIAMTVEGLSEFVGAYDDAYAKLIEYNNAVVSTNNAFELIGKAQIQGSLKTGEFLAAVQRDLFGGMDGFTEAVEGYFSALYTTTEQETARTAVATKQVERAFAELWPAIGIVHKSLAETSGTYLPKTREEFRSLVDSLDITTVTGAQAFAALMDISEAFGTMMDAADAAAEKLKDINSAMQDLDVRYLKATGQSDAADALSRQLSAQREIEQAIADNMGDAYIARLREVLQLEEQAVTSNMQDMSAILAQRQSLQDQLDIIEGRKTQRDLDLVKITDETNKALQQQIWAQQDAKTAADQLAAAEKVITDQRKDLQDQLDVLIGVRTQREIDLAKITDETNKALQQQIWAQQDAKTALTTAKENLQQAFDAEKKRLTQEHETQLQLLNDQLESTSSLVDDLTGYVDKLRAARKQMNLQDDVYQRSQYAAAQAMLAATLVAARGGDLSAIHNMDESLDILTNQGQDAYANSTDYQRDFWQVQNSIIELEALAGAQLTDAERALSLQRQQIDLLETNHNAQLAAMDAQLDALLGLNTAALSIEAAITQYTASRGNVSQSIGSTIASTTIPAASSIARTGLSTAQQAYYDYLLTQQGQGTPDTIYEYVSSLQDIQAAVSLVVSDRSAAGLTGDALDTFARSRFPGFAVGSPYIPYDMTANVHRGEMIVDPQSSAILRRYGIKATGSSDNRELVAEMRALREEQRVQAAELNKWTIKMSKTIDKWDVDGLPAGDGTSLTILAA